MKEIILPQNFKITKHAAQRFLERIINKEPYTQDDVDVSIEVIRNILTNRVLKHRRINKNNVQLIYRDAVFIYDNETESIITSHLNPKAAKKVEWIYKFPAPLQFKGKISSKYKVKLLTEGFMPLKKEGRIIIGQAGPHFYKYDSKYNIIKESEQN